MHKFGDVIEGRKNPMFNAIRLAAFAAAIVFGLAIATLNRAQAQQQGQTQNTTPTALPKLEYEVASIKPDQSDHSHGGMMDTQDGFTAANASLRDLIQSAFGIQNYQLSGGPDWINSERYVVDTRMDAATADALGKLSKHDRNIARQQMLQALLADRLKLTIHRETKELPVYFLIVGKNGPKLQEAKPGATYPNGLGPGVSTLSNWASQTMTVQAMPISSVALLLAGSLGRPVLDKTELTGKYDFTLKFATDRPQPQAAPGDSPSGQPPPGQLNPDAPFLLTAIQQQLGLKLESGRGPVEIIVIDHVERPSGN
jgi:uncharacterized protein (TIGR03435 family)